MHFSLKDHRNQLLLLLLSLSLVGGLIYGAIVPPWQAPDEPQHFEHARLIFEKQRLVEWTDTLPFIEGEIIASMDQYNYWSLGYVEASVFKPHEPPQCFEDIWWPRLAHQLDQPPLAYILYAASLFLASKSDVTVQLYIMRTISAIISALVAFVAFRTMEELFPDDLFLIIGVLSFILFLPTHAFLSGSVSNGHLAELLVSITLLIWVKSFKNSLSFVRLGSLALLIILGIFTKRTTIVAIPISIIGLLLYNWASIRSLLARWGMHVLGACAAFAAFGYMIWKLKAIPSALLQLLVHLRSELLHDYLFFPSDWPSPSNVPGYLEPEALRLYRIYLRVLFESFWARFGWMKIRLDAEWYMLLAGISLVACIGMVVFVSRYKQSTFFSVSWKVKSLVLFVTAGAMSVAVVIVNSLAAWQYGWQNIVRPQGRLLFPAIIPIATLFSLGLRGLVPARYERPFALLYILFLILLDFICLIAYILPYFYG